jgi:hypothetical protein
MPTDISTLTIFRDDLEDLFDLLHKQTGSVVTMTAQIGGRKYDLDHASDLGDSPEMQADVISMITETPVVSVDIDEYGARIYTSDGSLEAVGLVHAAKAILDRCARREVGAALLLVAGAVVFLGGLLGSAILSNRVETSFFVYEGPFLLGAALAPILFWLASRREKTSICTRTKRERGSWWRQHSAEVTTGVIVGGVVAVITFVLSKL